jgi:serine/threonine-protein kinase
MLLATRDALRGAMGFDVGVVIGGKYRVDGIVGRGGTSVVYRATHLELDRPVALKILSGDALRVPEYVARIRHEARAAACIKSEHVVRVFDVGETEREGAPYLVMELLEGRDLANVVARRGGLPLDFAIACIMQVCEVLAEAHAAGVVHRDLKPANLFLIEGVDGSPCVKVLDFGISLRQSGVSPLTDPGIVLGTPSYMAPEQMEARDAVGPRSDIWALGAILYELVVGRPAYKGESLPQIFLRIVKSETPRPSVFRRDVPREVDEVVARCLSIDPRDRFGSVAELAHALAACAPAAGAEASAPHCDAERVSRILARCKAEARASESAWARLARDVGGSSLRAYARRVAAATGAIVLGATMGFALFDPHAEPKAAGAAAPSSPPIATAPAADADASAPPARRRRAVAEGEARVSEPSPRGGPRGGAEPH